MASVAAVVSLMMLANSAVALPGKLTHLNMSVIGATVLGIVPATVIGVLLLDVLSDSAAHRPGPAGV